MRTVYFAVLDVIKALVVNGKKLDDMAATLEEIRQDVSLDLDPDSQQAAIDAATLSLQQTNDELESTLKKVS